MPLQNIEAREVRRFVRYGAGKCAAAMDKVGQQYVAFLVGSGDDAWGEIYRFSAGGQEMPGGWRVDPKPEPAVGENKVDDVTIQIVKLVDGRTSLRFGCISHLTGQPPGTEYVTPWSMVDIFDSGAVYDPGNPEHGDNARPIEIQPVEGGGELTEAQMNQIAEKVVNLLDARMGGLDLRGDFEGKVKDGLIELMTRDFDTKSNIYLDLLARFVRDRSYEANVAYHGPRNEADEQQLDWLRGEEEMEVQDNG